MYSNKAEAQKKETRDSLIQVLNDFRSAKDFNSTSEDYVTALVRLGEQLRYHNSDSLLLLGEQAAMASDEMNFVKGKAMAYMNLGDYYSDQAAHEKSLEFYNKALVEATSLKDNNLILQVKYCLTIEYNYQGDLASSFKEYLSAIELAEALGNLKMQSILNENMANMYFLQKNYKEALHHYQMAEEANLVLDNEISTAFTNSNFATLLIEMGYYQKSLSYIDKSIAVFKKERMMDWLAYAYSTKGSYYLKQKKYNEALIWFNKSRALHEEQVEDKRAQITLLHSLSEVNLGLKHYEIAENYAKQAYGLAVQLKEYDEIRNAAQTLSSVYKRNNDFEKSLEYYEIFKKTSDSLSQNDSKKNLIMLKAKLKYEEEKSSLIASNEKEIAKKENYIYLILLVLLVLIIITMLIRRSERAQEILNKELNLKNEKLETQEYELREINHTKDKLFSIIAHDLKSPINSFKGLIEFYKNGNVTEKELLTFIPRLGSNIENISFTLNNLLSWSQNQMKRNLTKPSMVSIDNIVQENINLLSEVATKKSIQVVNEITKNTMVWVDASEIDIVIRNLISNALKFTPNQGLIIIKSKLRDKDWIISVKDNGVGMTKESQRKIFNNSANVSTYGTDNEKGTGLGLALCKEMVERNKGTIWVESDEEKGTCFYFTAPKKG